MRRKIWVVASIALIIGLLAGSVSCSTPTPTPTPTPAPTQSPKPTTATTPAATTPAATTPAATAKPIVLKTASTNGPTHVVRLQLERAMELVKQRAGGRIQFDYYPGGSLYNLQTSSDALMSGLIQVGDFKGGYFPDKLGIAGDVANLPYNASFEGFAKHRNDPGGFYEWIRPYYEKNNVRLMSYDMTGISVDISSKKPIRKLEDVKGILIRTVAGAGADGFKMLGAQPVFLAAGDIYEALQRGTVDATNSGLTVVLASKLYESAKYYTVAKYSATGMEIAMNLQAFKGLPPDLQKIVIDAFDETEKKLYDDMPATYLADQATFKSKGGELIVLDDKEIARWTAAIQPLYETYAKKYGADWDKFMKIREKLLNP